MEGAYTVNIWPFNRNTESRSYSNAVDELAYLQASRGTLASFEGTALYAGITGLWSRAFASATVEGADMPATLLGAIGRELITRGEACIDMNDGVAWRRPSTWQITGGDEPSSWQYRLTFTGPSQQRIVQRPAAGVLHFTYETNVAAPWRGVSPLRTAMVTCTAYAELEAMLERESKMNHGQLLSLPIGQQELADVRKSLAMKKGVIDLFSTANRPEVMTPKPLRYGPEPASTVLEMHTTFARAIASAAGIPAPLFSLVESSSGVEARETWRQFLASSVRPVGDRLAAELTEKLDRPVSISWQSLAQSDIAARSRAAGILARDLQLPPADALTIVGLR